MKAKNIELYPHDLKTALKYTEMGYKVTHLHRENDRYLENPTQIIKFITESIKKTANTEIYNMYWAIIPE